MLELQSSPATIQIPTNLLIELEASICRDSLHEFVKAAWHVVFPHEKYVDGPHVKLICDELEACFYGRQKRLIINIPPRHMKSTLVNVFFPAWVWTRAPGRKFICTSHSEKLTSRDSLLCRTLITSEWYQQRFPVRLNRDQSEKLNFMNTDMGYRKGYGLSGITGEGGDFILVDDPISAEDSESDAVRDQANHVMDAVLPSRASEETVIILIMQRLHEDDPAGHILNKDGSRWEQLILPAEYEGERFVSSLGFVDFRTEMGQLLWPERFGTEFVENLKVELGSEYLIASQLQQRPVPEGGNAFKQEWFNERLSGYKIAGYYLSIDTASTVGENSAKSAILVGALTGDFRLVPVYVWAGKVTFTVLVDKIEEVAKLFREKLFGVVIEAKDNGRAAIDTIEANSPKWLAEKVHPFIPPAKPDKIGRARVASKWCENGSVCLPVPSDENADWLLDFEDQLFKFPSGKYKDMVDCLVQLIFVLVEALSRGHQHRLKKV